MSFMLSADPRLSLLNGARSYGASFTRRQIARIASAAAVCGAALLSFGAAAPAQPPAPVKIVALGDSLTAGLGLADGDSFPTRLQAALAAKGVAVEIANAGVSGDTASAGLARLDWSVPDGTGAVILELGANDMLRGIDPGVTRDALDTILRRLRERHIAVLICGMRAAPNFGADYGRAFESIYPALAAKYGIPLYPFFLDGVAGNLGLLQHDGLHPTPAGVAMIVARILPQVEDLLARIRSQHVRGERPS
jgi:acyl-CoA thioesterase-1